jgi:hypothetical protein
MTDICAHCGDLLTNFEIENFGDMCFGCKSEEELIYTNKYHVCNVLKDFTKDLYFIENNTYKDNILYWLDYVLCSNQHISNTFTTLFKLELGSDKFYKKYRTGIFPKFLMEYDTNIIAENSDRIDKEIDKIKPFKPGPIDKDKKIIKLIETINKIKLLDLTIPYRNIISILKNENDRELERAEYGYFIGSLINIKVQELLKKYGQKRFPPLNRTVLKTRVLTFRKRVFKTMSIITGDEPDPDEDKKCPLKK